MTSCDVMAQTKIGLTGVHASGKTLKAKELRDHYSDADKSVLIVDEVARSCPLALRTIEAQEYIWQEQMMREKAAMAQDVDVIICDRVVLGNLMYYFDIISNEDQKGINRWRDLFQEAVAWMPTYTQVIRLPLNLEYLKADDPIRPNDIDYAKRIDRLFDRFVQPYVTEP